MYIDLIDSEQKREREREKEDGTKFVVCLGKWESCEERKKDKSLEKKRKKNSVKVIVMDFFSRL